jgi:hypothetical protein
MKEQMELRMKTEKSLMGNDRIRVFSWSHCCGEWQFAWYAKSQESALSRITKMGHDVRFYKFQ